MESDISETELSAPLIGRSGRSARVAIIHEWLTIHAGSEQVLEQICALYPTAEIYCVVADPEALSDWAFLQGRIVHTSFIQRLPAAVKRYRNYLLLMPMAIEQFDLSDFDVIISSSHAVAKGVLTGPDQLHISYVHSPMRYAWDLQHRYLNESKLQWGLKSLLVRWLLHRLRIWDCRTGPGVDFFIANSRFIGRRIWRVYRRESDVIYPPVNVDAFPLRLAKEKFYLAASRMVPYKRMDLIVRAFAGMPDKQLVVIGDGPDMSKVSAESRGEDNIQILGHQAFDSLRDYMARAQGFVFAAEEDFGIVVVEALACGTPVIAYGRGGARESIVSGGLTPTGLFFDEQTVESIQQAIEDFEASPTRFEPQHCRNRAEQFSIGRFRSEFSSYVRRRWAQRLAEVETPAQVPNPD
jgi:glycosyltransferase involved in cell wall biosynthesis